MNLHVTFCVLREIGRHFVQILWTLLLHSETQLEMEREPSQLPTLMRVTHRQPSRPNAMKTYLTHFKTYGTLWQAKRCYRIKTHASGAPFGVR